MVDLSFTKLTAPYCLLTGNLLGALKCEFWSLSKVTNLDHAFVVHLDEEIISYKLSVLPVALQLR